MDYRLSYMQSVEDSFPNELASSINPCVNLKNAFAQTDILEPNHLKVYLRIRPLLPDEHSETKEEHVEILNDQSISVTGSSHAQSLKNNTKISHNFTFSHVYGTGSSQKLIFDQTADELVKDVLNGQNCLLFTYGATNSGKTFTIQGTEHEPGLLPRTLVSLFDSVSSSQYLKEDLMPHHFCSVIRLSEEDIKKEREFKDAILKSKDFSRVSTCSNFSYISCSSKDYGPQNGTNNDNTQVSTVLDVPQGSVPGSPCFSIFISFAEIYNEYVYDLLEKITHHRNIKRTPLAFGEDNYGSIYIKGLKHIKVCSVEEAIQVLEVGRQNLHFATTQLNQNSSRSHCIFTIKLVRLFDPTNPQLATTSMLSLCDLAGAERATKTLNSHDRLKEANNINTSLLVLGRCIAALRCNQSVKHSITKKVMPVPYRDSKVTRLFQSFFMGKGLLTMIVNISKSTQLIDDTLKVLKFSAIARKVAIVPNKAYIDHRVAKQRESNKFSQFMRNSFNMSKGSIRFSVPWANSTTSDVTFGAVEEENECTKDETYEEEESHEALLELIKKLTDRLIMVNKEKQEMEKNVRKEVGDAFCQRLVEIENLHRCRIEEERFRSEELMDWRVNAALESNDVTNGSKKRRRSGDEGDNRRESALTQFQDELKIQEISEERDLLKQELEAVKASLKSVTQSGKLLQEDNTKLTFQLSIATESLTAVESEKEKADNVMTAVLSGPQQVETAVIDRQQQKISDLLKDLEFEREENNTVNILLKEAAEEFIDKDQKLTTTQETLLQQNVILSDLENQLFEAKAMISSHVTALEEREKTIYELQGDLKKLNIAAKASSEPQTPGLESDGESKGKEVKLMNKNRLRVLRDAEKNQSLIDFEKSEKKINKQHRKIEPEEDILSKSLVNNEDLSRCGEAPADDVANTEDVEELRRILETLKLSNVQELEQAWLNSQSQLVSATKKYNETDEELVNMCKLNESLQNEVLTNRNKINYLESDLFGTKTNLTSAKLEVESLVAYHRRTSIELKRSNEKDVEIVELRSNLAHMKEMNSKLATEVQEAKERQTALGLKLETCANQLMDLATLQTTVDSLNKEKLTLEQKCAELEENIHTLEKSLQDQGNLSSNLTNKMECLDRKLSENESANELLLKQLAAISEARKEEFVKYESTLGEKNSEILTLEKEVKDMIIKRKMDDGGVNVKQEEDNIKMVEEKLRRSELEKSSLVCHVTDLEKKLAERNVSYEQLEAELSAVSLSKKISGTLDGIDQSQGVDKFVTPVPVTRSTKLRSASNKNGTEHCQISGDEEPKSKTRSMRAKRHNVTSGEKAVTFDLQNTVESSGEETPVVESSARRSGRKPRGRAKKNALPNPHIPDEKDKENKADPVSENRRSTRKRRPLYNVDDDHTLDGSPSLKSNEQQEMYTESPHTISRRQLRSKFK